MRYALPIFLVGVALTGALALHQWRPTHTEMRSETVGAVTGQSARVPYTGLTTIVSVSVPTRWWWKDPAAVFVVFAGVAVAAGVLTGRRVHALSSPDY